jgi:hypothetical protein
MIWQTTHSINKLSAFIPSLNEKLAYQIIKSSEAYLLMSMYSVLANSNNRDDDVLESCLRVLLTW